MPNVFERTGRHDCRRDASRYANEPGYMDPIADRHERERHRDKIRKRAYRREARAEGLPIGNAIDGLMVDALALFVERFPKEAREVGFKVRLLSCLKLAVEANGFATSERLVDMVERRLVVDPRIEEFEVRRDAERELAARRAARRTG